jgi:leader peptidase (prepilin peptidase)/N-methyltransferase
MFAASWEDGVFVAGAFVAGAIIGSFLNVVGHRVPAGRSVVAGRSACPACGRPVRPRDNVPVLGWLMLRGRCRDCGAAIPATYALVEAGCGLALAALAAVEIVAWHAAGSSLPLIDRIASLGEFGWLLGWLARAVATLTIVAWALLGRAGHLVAWKTVILMAVLSAALVTAASPDTAWGAAGAVGGAAAGWLLGGASGPTGHRILILTGAAGGWPAAALTVVLTVTTAALRRALRAEGPNDRPGAHRPTEMAVAAAASLIAVGVVWPAIANWFQALWSG